ncbi:choice-of-anchor Q domain-containing protein [Tautonia plasticadhaerens]|uniref:choice-of-anchor Q domain-containing protein n=1 Tax=Tautonia plasticadhaerens TaxID=2527974 RepID=UPI0028F4385D|nr:choice-of-anchor Q domain-containing protein [Tautonia plasticadhaerens]
MDARENFLGVLDPRLGPLADNGGPTRTHAPLADSPAVDTGVDALSVGLDGMPLSNDQRGPGFPRRGGTAVDAGAMESGFSVDRSAPEASSLVVTTLDDLSDRFDGQTSLREALSYAADLPGSRSSHSSAAWPGS